MKVATADSLHAQEPAVGFDHTTGHRQAWKQRGRLDRMLELSDTEDGDEWFVRQSEVCQKVLLRTVSKRTADKTA